MDEISSVRIKNVQGSWQKVPSTGTWMSDPFMKKPTTSPLSQYLRYERCATVSPVLRPYLHPIMLHWV